MAGAAELHRDDQGALLDLLAEVGAVEDLEAFATTATQGILDLVPGLSASYNELNTPCGRAFAVILPDPGPEWFARYQPPFEAHLHQHPIVAHVQATGDTRALSWDDVAHVGPMAGTDLHRCFYRPNGIWSQLVMTLPAPPGILVAFAVNRGPEGFTARDRAVLDALRPHLVHAYRNVQHRAAADALGSVADAHGWAVVLVDDDGRVLRSSDGAVDIASRFGLDVGDGSRLEAGPLARVRSITAAYRPGTPATPSTPLLVSGDAGTLEAVVVPSPVGAHVVLLQPGPGAVHAALARTGLTPRQVEVAAALATGATNQQIARHLGIAAGTVKKHLEVIYARLEVGQRAAAVSRINSLR